MIGSRVRTHLNQDQEDGLSIFKEEKNFFILLMIPDLMDIEVLGKYCHFLTEFVTSASFNNATEFDAAVSDAFRTANLPLSFSIACLLREDDVVYLKTFGGGEVFLRRDDRKIPLVKHGAYASGKIELGDEVALSIGEHDPFVTLENCVHIEFGLEEQTESLVAQDISKGKSVAKKTNLFQMVRERLKNGRTGALAVVLIVGALLLMNVLSSYTSKASQEDRLNLENATEVITQKLEQAQDVFELNSKRSIALLAEAKQDLKSLQKKLHNNYSFETKKLSDRISATEKKILQKNIKIAEEFIDLGLEEKGAQGTTMWRYEDGVVIVNPKGAIYILSLEKKSLEARSSTALSGSSLAGLDESVVYVYRKGKGIIKIESEDSKPVVVIGQDKDWGTIADLKVYNKNLYLLDSSKGQIYKYIPTDEGFATKSAYFKSGAYAKNASSFAIDQSVYVAQSRLITKYTSGLQDGFSPTYPNDGPLISRVLTGNDVDDLYVWDKTHGSLVILSKTGDYKKTIESSVLSKATSVDVYKNSAYALIGSKIYKVSLK